MGRRCQWLIGRDALRVTVSSPPTESKLSVPTRAGYSDSACIVRTTEFQPSPSFSTNYT